jgi:triosephosphate isomerase
MTIAYEPLWAIGNLGHHATPQQAQDAHALIRRRVGQMFGEKSARTLVIQYGGSVKPENAAALLGQPGVDGALVGGASLDADQFLAIVQAHRTPGVEDLGMVSCAALWWLISLKSAKGIEPRASPRLLESNF